MEAPTLDLSLVRLLSQALAMVLQLRPPMLALVTFPQALLTFPQVLLIGFLMLVLQLFTIFSRVLLECPTLLLSTLPSMLLVCFISSTSTVALKDHLCKVFFHNSKAKIPHRCPLVPLV